MSSSVLRESAERLVLMGTAMLVALAGTLRSPLTTPTPQRWEFCVWVAAAEVERGASSALKICREVVAAERLAQAQLLLVQDWQPVGFP